MNESQDFTKNVDSLSASNQNSTTSKVKQNNPTALSAICHFFLMIGSIITFIRNTVFNIIFIFLIIAIFALAGLYSKFEDSAKDLAWIEDPDVTNQVLTKPRAILYFDLNGPIIESALPNDDYSKFTRMLDAKLNNRNVNDILSIEKTLHNATYNKTIKALYFNLSGLSGTTLSVAKRVIAAINQFKAVNKDADVIAYADNYSASAYAIASACKTIVLNPFGSFTFKGLSSTTLYFKDLFDRLRIDPVIFKAGEFKSAVEPFTNNKMSPQVKEEYQEIFTKLWAEYLDTIGEQKLRAKTTLTKLFYSSEVYLRELEQYGGSEAVLLHNLQLVDELQSQMDVEAYLIKKYGASKDPFKADKQDYHQYFASLEKQSATATNNTPEGKVAVIYGIGNITDISTDATDFTPANIQSQLTQAVKDPAVKAIVFYINSGGGSVTASEKIRNMLLHVKHKKNIPIYVSMNSLCASGAYWISTAADKIFATNETITGSIGVFAIGFSAHRLLNEYGVYQDGVATNDLATVNIANPLSESQVRAQYLEVKSIYENFVGLVKAARKPLKNEDYHKFAEGKIFMAQDAYNLGLVDKLGTLEDVIKFAKVKVGKLNKVKVEHLAPEDTSSKCALRDLFLSVGSGIVPDIYLKAGLDLLFKEPKILEKPTVMAISQVKDVAF